MASHQIADLHGIQSVDVVAQEDKISSADDQQRLSAASLEILIDRFSNSSKKKKKRKQPETTPDRMETGGGLSTDRILKLAAARIVLSSTWTGEDGGIINNDPFIVNDGLTLEESKNVELMECLLRSAEKLEKGEVLQANNLLDICYSSRTGNPIQRAAYYFSSALRERMKTTGDKSSPVIGTTGEIVLPARCWEYNFHGKVPFFMASQLAGVQAILEVVGSEKRVHVLDLKIRSGLAMVGLIQALSGRRNGSPPLELLRVTAVANDDAEVEVCRETGVRLASFAEEVNVPFEFKIAQAQAFGLRKSQLQLNSGEAMVIYSEYALSPLISTPGRLYALMRLVKTLRPRLMLMIDTEANHNSPDFGHRFVDSLFTAAACFDCLAECYPADDDPTTSAVREAMEARHLGERIRNVVAAEREERVVRDVKMGVWRKYFARWGMLEVELSELAVSHARRVVNRFPCGASCVVGTDGKSVVMGWKDTPLISVSTWKLVGSRKAKAGKRRSRRDDVVVLGGVVNI